MSLFLSLIKSEYNFLKVFLKKDTDERPQNMMLKMYLNSFMKWDMIFYKTPEVNHC